MGYETAAASKRWEADDRSSAGSRGRHPDTAESLVARGLREDRQSLPDRRRAPLRDGRPALGRAGPRRRLRQRQRGDRRGAALRRVGGGGLRPRASRAWAGARRRRGARGRVRRGRRAGAPVRRRLVRRRAVDLRRHVRAGPGEDGGGAAPSLPAGRADRDGELDAGRADRRRHVRGPSPSTRRRRRGSSRRRCGAPRSASGSCSGTGSPS